MTPTIATPEPTPPAAPAGKVWTMDDLLAMPDDGVERWVIRGQLREKPSEYPEVKMTVRNRTHSMLTISVGAVIKAWVKTQPAPRGQVYGGEAGVRLRGTAENGVGIDVVYFSPDVVAAQAGSQSTMLVGVPTLVVEILSPNDTVEQIDEKVREYQAVGVPLVWIVHPTRRTVTLMRPNHPDALFAVGDRLPDAPEMPGFAPAVAELFE